MRALKKETFALWLAIRDPRVPWAAKALGILVIAYAVSPIDLIPDFIPVLGYLDDLLIVPLGVWLTLRMIPPEVMSEARVQAEKDLSRPIPQFRWMAALIVLLWAATLLFVGYVLFRWVRK